jgi:hypothetical protein
LLSKTKGINKTDVERVEGGDKYEVKANRTVLKEADGTSGADSGCASNEPRKYHAQVSRCAHNRVNSDAMRIYVMGRHISVRKNERRDADKTIECLQESLISLRCLGIFNVVLYLP